eukprot:IDg4811t1
MRHLRPRAEIELRSLDVRAPANDWEAVPPSCAHSMFKVEVYGKVVFSVSLEVAGTALSDLSVTRSAKLTNWRHHKQKCARRSGRSSVQRPPRQQWYRQRRPDGSATDNADLYCLIGQQAEEQVHLEEV